MTERARARKKKKWEIKTFEIDKRFLSFKWPIEQIPYKLAHK